jgi:FKBP-type peptidyl-prolyl cis-trans isomerase SlpA
MSASQALPIVKANSEIAISYRMCLNDQTCIDQTEPGELFRFTLGDGSLLPNLETLLIGLELGTEGRFFVPPEDGFGYPDPSNIYAMSKNEFPAEMSLKPGDVVGFNTPTGEEIPGTVVALADDQVTVDFNHPLAGETFIFEVKIEAIYDSLNVSP